MNKNLIRLASMLVKLENLETDKGVIVISEPLEVGVEILKEDGSDVEDGEYELEDKILVVKEGKVAEINAKEPEKTEEEVKVEVESAEEPAEEAVPDEKDVRIEELEGLLKDRDAVIEELTAKIKELEDKLGKPVEDPVDIKQSVQTREDLEKEIPALKYFKN